MRVSRSTLHGCGVFANVHIPPATCIGPYEGELLRECPRDCTYVMCLTVDHDEYVYIDARDATRANFTRFLNDPGPGCSSNCEFVQDDLSVEVRTCRHIQPGEELTVKYMHWHTHVGSVASGAKTRRRRARQG